MLPSIKLKRNMYLQFWVIIVLYFGNKIINSLLYTFINSNIASRNLIIANIVIELVLVVALTITLRARKWPDYF